jgi:crossover junction endodeoxyribonuclease RusA
MDAPSEIVFEVPGQPVPQPRHKVAARGRFAHAYIPAHHPIHAYRETIALVGRAARVEGWPTAGPVAVEIEAVFGRPPSHWRKSGLAADAPAWPPRCDWDNLAKGICDALTGILWHDDDQVIDGRCRKRYAERGEAPRTLVMVRRL